MNKLTYTLLILSLTILIQGCSSMEVDPNRAGCYYGKARYGSLTQYVKGTGAHVFRGKNMKDAKITCNKDTQEIVIE